jgi:hypothetical protein
MENKNTFLTVLTGVIRWIARIVGLLAVLFVGIFAAFEGLGGDHAGGSDIPVVMIIGTVLMMGGLLAAWKWDFWGGLASLTGFFIVAENNSGVWHMPLMVILFMAPAVLFIFCGLIRRFRLKKAVESEPE